MDPPNNQPFIFSTKTIDPNPVESQQPQSQQVKSKSQTAKVKCFLSAGGNCPRYEFESLERISKQKQNIFSFIKNKIEDGCDELLKKFGIRRWVKVDVEGGDQARIKAHEFCKRLRIDEKELESKLNGGDNATRLLHKEDHIKGTSAKLSEYNQIADEFKSGNRKVLSEVSDHLKFKHAAFYFEKSAFAEVTPENEYDVIQAVCSLADIYQEGGHGIDQDKEYAMELQDYAAKLLSNAAERNEEEAVKRLKKINQPLMKAMAYFSLGEKAERNNNNSEAFSYYLSSASVNFPKGFYKLGEMYETGKAPKGKNTQHALENYIIAAENGHREAKEKLADFYFSNPSEKNSLKTAILNDLKTKALENNKPFPYPLDLIKDIALYNHDLAIRYFNRIINEHSEIIDIESYPKEESSNACFEIAEQFEKAGEIDKAIDWYILSGSNGNENAINALQSIANRGGNALPGLVRVLTSHIVTETNQEKSNKLINQLIESLEHAGLINQFIESFNTSGKEKNDYDSAEFALSVKRLLEDEILSKISKEQAYEIGLALQYIKGKNDNDNVDSISYKFFAHSANLGHTKSMAHILTFLGENPLLSKGKPTININTIEHLAKHIEKKQVPKYKDMSLKERIAFRNEIWGLFNALKMVDAGTIKERDRIGEIWAKLYAPFDTEIKREEKPHEKAEGYSDEEITRNKEIRKEMGQYFQEVNARTK